MFFSLLLFAAYVALFFWRGQWWLALNLTGMALLGLACIASGSTPLAVFGVALMLFPAVALYTVIGDWLSNRRVR